MYNIEKVMLRKVKNREFAINNLGLNSTSEKDDFDDVNMANGFVLRRDLEENLSLASQNSVLDGHEYLRSNKRFIGSVIVFFKKVQRKLLKIFMGWYIFPIFEKRNYFNLKVINSISILRTMVYDNSHRIHELENNLLEMRNDLERKETSLKLCNIGIHELESNLLELKKRLDEKEALLNYVKNVLNITCDYKLLEDRKSINYFEFENKFRGTREKVREIQSHIVNFFKEKEGIILDIGCGRGEFLQLMSENDISALGIDVYIPFVEYCSELGLNVIQADAITYLNSLPNGFLGGINMSQIVEHLNTDYLMKIIQLAYNKLSDGGYLVIQTPNPESLFTYIDFYIDMEHKKPIHFKTLEFLCQEEGFSEITRVNPSETKFKNVVTNLKAEGIENTTEFNYGMDNLNEWLTGYQDYILVAKKGSVK